MNARNKKSLNFDQDLQRNQRVKLGKFLSAKREKTEIKSKIYLIYDLKLKYDIIGREIRRKT